MSLRADNTFARDFKAPSFIKRTRNSLKGVGKELKKFGRLVLICNVGCTLGCTLVIQPGLERKRLSHERRGEGPALVVQARGSVQ